MTPGQVSKGDVADVCGWVKLDGFGWMVSLAVSKEFPIFLSDSDIVCWQLHCSYCICLNIPVKWVLDSSADPHPRISIFNP